MSDYLQSGMFAKSGATFKRKVVGDGMEFEEVLQTRVGHFRVCDIFRVAAFMIVILLAIVPATLVVQGYQLAGVNMEYGVVLIKGYLTVVGHIYVAFIPTIVVLAFLNWRGRPIVYTSSMAKISFAVSFFCCCIGHGEVAAVIMSLSGMVSWWLNTKTALHRWNYYSIVGVVGVLGLIVIVTPWFSVYLLFTWLLYRSVLLLSHQKQDIVNQVEVRVDNGAQRYSVDKAFAIQVVPLAFDGVPEDLLQLVTHIPSLAENNNAFRRWAQLGDVVLANIVVLHGVHSSAHVGKISDWKQTCLSNDTMSALVLSIPGAKERCTGLNGVLSRKFSSEMVEALTGLAWYYSYDRGKSLLWEADSLSFACERLGLPRRVPRFTSS